MSFNHHVTRHFLERVNRKKPLEQLLYPASPRGAACLDVSPARARSWRLLGDKEHRETARPGTQAQPARIPSSKTSPGCPGLAESQKSKKVCKPGGTFLPHAGGGSQGPLWRRCLPGRRATLVSSSGWCGPSTDRSLHSLGKRNGNFAACLGVRQGTCGRDTTGCCSSPGARQPGEAGGRRQRGSTTCFTPEDAK